MVLDEYETARSSSNSGKIERILGIRKVDEEMLALVVYEDGTQKVEPTKRLIEICPKVSALKFLIIVIFNC